MLGAVFLFDPAGADIDFARGMAGRFLSATLTSALLLVGVLGCVMRVRRRKVVTGAEEMIGLEGRGGELGAAEQGASAFTARRGRRGPRSAARRGARRCRARAREGLTLDVVPTREKELTMIPVGVLSAGCCQPYS